MRKEEIEKIIELVLQIVEKIPEEYRHTTYEILLEALLKQQVKPLAQPPERMDSAGPSHPAKLKAFLKSYDLSPDLLARLFLIEGNSIEPIYKIDMANKRQAQLSIALLEALKNSMKDGVFAFSVESVRTIVKGEGCYDDKNFSTYWREFESLFKGMEDQERVELASTGLKTLADLVLQLTSVE